MSKKMKYKYKDILVTAVITTFNRPNLFPRALRSVLAQTYKPLEIIVVEDGSESGINSWLKKEGIENVRYIRHDKNKGLAAARNTGLKFSKGEYIAYLDDDDEWKPERIEKQIFLLKKLSPEQCEKMGVIYCGSEIKFRDNSVTIHPRNKGNLKEAIIREGAKTLSSVSLFSREALEKVGGFDEGLPSSIDHDIWMTLASYEYFAYTLDEALVVSYSRYNHNTMMNDTITRIRGVRMYVDKWTPTYQKWFGEKNGIIYGRKYFARVIANLVADRIGRGNFLEAGQAICAIFKYCNEIKYNIFIILKAIGAFVARRFLPYKIFSLIKVIKRKFME